MQSSAFQATASASQTAELIHAVDDDPSVRQSIQILAASLSISCVAYESAEDFIERFEPGIPGCLIVDLMLKGTDGFSLLREYSAPKYLLPGIAISGVATPQLALRAIQEGAVTFLDKSCAPDDLRLAINKCLELSRYAAAAREREAPVRQRLAELTDSERAVLEQLIAGGSNRSIALEMGVSERTLERRRASLLGKLQARSAAEAGHMVGLVSSTEGGLPRRWPVPAALLAGAIDDDPPTSSAGDGHASLRLD